MLEDDAVVQRLARLVRVSDRDWAWVRVRARARARARVRVRVRVRVRFRVRVRVGVVPRYYATPRDGREEAGVAEQGGDGGGAHEARLAWTG